MTLAVDWDVKQQTNKSGAISSLPANGLLINFANILDPDQDRQNVCPDLDPNSQTLCSDSVPERMLEK